MHRQHQQMMIRCSTIQNRAKEWCALQSKRYSSLFNGTPTSFISRSLEPQIDKINESWIPRVTIYDPCEWLAILLLEGGPKRFMPIYENSKAIFKSFSLQFARHLNGNRHVINRILRIHLLNEPKSALRTRKQELGC